MNNQTFTLDTFNKYAEAGRACDIDFLMRILDEQDEFLTHKMIDAALGLVETREGRIRLRHFLFEGSTIQRNYAVLYFKRLGITDVVEEAFKRGCVDEVQAFSR